MLLKVNMNSRLPLTELTDWQLLYLRVAQSVSVKSKDPSSKLGAVAVSNQGLPLSWGWNGFPRSIPLEEDKVDRSFKYAYIVHAEMNAIYNANRESVSLLNSSFYIYGIPPCLECAKGLIQVGVKEIHTLCHDEINIKWLESYEQSLWLFQNAGIKARTYAGNILNVRRS